MEKYLSQIRGTPVINEQGQLLSRVLDLAVNTETGKVAGFLLAPTGKKVIAPIDVIAWNDQLVINDPEDILDIHELHQVRKILENNVRIFGNKVYTKDGVFLGKVTNYAVHLKFLSLTKIVVSKSFLGLIKYGRLIIGSRDILEIKKDAIIVRNLNEPVTIEKLKPVFRPEA